MLSPAQYPDLHAALFDLLARDSVFSTRRTALNFQEAVADLLASDDSELDGRTMGELRDLWERLAKGLGIGAWIEDDRCREWSEARTAAYRILSNRFG